MKITLAIATYNRADIWRNKFLVNSIGVQTRKPDEIIVVDDGSTDDTLAVVKEMLPEARLFRVTAPKRTEHHDSAMADQVIYREATGDLLVHIDDDGFVNNRLIEFVGNLGLGAVYYGNNAYIDPITKKRMGIDSRVDKLGCATGKAVQMGGGFCQGALYAVEPRLVRELGGHDMEYIGYRGCDNRLGRRLETMVPAWFMNAQYMTFYHWGYSKYIEMQRGDGTLSISAWRVPELGDGTRCQVIANGGVTFWEHGLDGMYEEV